MKRLRKIFTTLILVGFVFLAVYSIFLLNTEQVNNISIILENPTLGTVINKTVIAGSIVPRIEIEIKSNISGIIRELIVIEGQKVKKGDVIAKIQVIPNMITLNNAESVLKKTKIRYDLLKEEYLRHKKLYDERVIAESLFLMKENDYKVAFEEFEAAQNNLQLIKEGVPINSKSQSNTIVYSTIDGIVLSIPVKNGSSVIETNPFNAGTTICTIADINDMIFIGKINESEIGKIREGMEMLISVGAIEDKLFDATLEYIAPKGEKEGGAVQFNIIGSVILKDSSYIRAGFSANAEIITERKDNVMLIPERLLQFSGDSCFVEVMNDNLGFEKQFLTIGISDGIRIEVVEGLSLSDKIKSAK